eukprot:752594-Hanusia_phi.AAC.3
MRRRRLLLSPVESKTLSVDEVEERLASSRVCNFAGKRAGLPGEVSRRGRDSGLTLPNSKPASLTPPDCRRRCIPALLASAQTKWRSEPYEGHWCRLRLADCNPTPRTQRRTSSHWRPWRLFLLPPTSLWRSHMPAQCSCRHTPCPHRANPQQSRWQDRNS